MNKGNDFRVMLDNVSTLGDDEKQTIEVARDVSDIIASISAARVASGLTQRQVAKMSGIKQSAIARMESLRAIPKLDTVVKVARCLGLSVCTEKTSFSAPGQGQLVYLANYQKDLNPDSQYHWKHDMKVEGDFVYGSLG